MSKVSIGRWVKPTVLAACSISGRASCGQSTAMVSWTLRSTALANAFSSSRPAM
jgi:hypothetical protein